VLVGIVPLNKLLTEDLLDDSTGWAKEPDTEDIFKVILVFSASGKKAPTHFIYRERHSKKKLCGGTIFKNQTLILVFKEIF
jgi:hypothetical protein